MVRDEKVAADTGKWKFPSLASRNNHPLEQGVVKVEGIFLPVTGLKLFDCVIVILKGGIDISVKSLEKDLSKFSDFQTSSDS